MLGILLNAQFKNNTIMWHNIHCLGEKFINSQITYTKTFPWEKNKLASLGENKFQIEEGLRVSSH
jgi:hypothetical protein